MKTILRPSASALGLLLFATACANTSSAPTPTTSVAAVSAAEASLAAAGRAILSCYSVPACASVAPKPVIKADYDKAYGAVTAAQTVADAGGSPDMAAATAALSVLQTDVTALPTPSAS